MPNSCHICNSEFSFFKWEFKCPECNSYTCRDCFKELEKLEWLCEDPFKYLNTKFFGVEKCICKNCWNKKALPIIDYYKFSLKKSDEIELVSINYKGPKSEINNYNIKLITPWYRNKSDAEECLKVTASFLDRELINKFTWENATNSYDNYYYSIWRAVGNANDYE